MLALMVHLGPVIALIGLVGVVKPMRFLLMPTRLRALIVVMAGLVITALALSWPSGARGRAPGALEAALPEYHFMHAQSVRIHATPAQVFDAIDHVTPYEIHAVRTLLWARDPSAPDRHHSLLTKPLSEIVTRAGFIPLVDQRPKQLVLGAIGKLKDGADASPDDKQLRAGPYGDVGESVRLQSETQFSEFEAPGYSKAAIGFRVEDEGAGWSLLTSEVRVLGMEAHMRRMLSRCEHLASPEMGWIHGDFLAAIKRRAEAPALPATP